MRPLVNLSKYLLGIAFLLSAISLVSPDAQAASVVQTATLHDLRTVGSTDKKMKHQQYDLWIDTSANEYVCRSKLGSKVKPTEFVVGSTVEFTLNGQNGEARNATGNKVKCGIVRVALLPEPQ